MRLAIVTLASISAACAGADDWPTYMGDNARSGVSTESLPTPLAEIWRYEARHAPKPAWPPPAKDNIWHKLEGLKGAVQFDRAHQTVIADGLLYFGSSAEDKLVCLDASTGEERWTYLTDGPVRLAPSIDQGRAYFGADDGHAYCLDARSGELIWQVLVPPKDRRIPGNGRIISDKPIRSGVLVDEGVAYCFAGIFPAYGVYGCAIDADTGELLWRKKMDGASPQGYLLASAETLFVPSGRMPPVMIARATGEARGTLPGPGGAFALLTGDELVTGPGRTTGSVELASTTTKASIAAFNGIRMIVSGGIAFLQSDARLVAIDRARRADLSASGEDAAGAEIWSRETTHASSLILAGDALIAGGDGEILIVDAKDGSEIARAPVSGNAFGLSAAGGRVYVSTDEGVIHCFGSGSGETKVVAPRADPEVYADDDSTLVRRVRTILAETEIDQGYALVLDETDGEMAYEIARNSRLQVVALIAYEREAAQAREKLDRAGMLGARVTVHVAPPGKYPHASHLFNLIVSRSSVTTTAPPSRDPVRLLRPEGGIICLGSRRPSRNGLTSRALRALWGDAPACEVVNLRKLGPVVTRGKLPGAGTWTSAYGDLANTAASSDTVGGELALRWFGEPGPEPMVDRHHRAMSSLIADGRLIVPGNDVLIAADAYNGAPLWERSVPGLRRVGVGKNCGHIILDEGTIYAAVQDDCWVLDAATGETLAEIPVPMPDRDWGYVGASGDQLIGTATQPGAAVSDHDMGAIALVYYDRTPQVLSESVFAIDKDTQAESWRHESGAILNSTIAISEGRVYLVEARGDALDASGGRASVDSIYANDAHIVALSARTGKVVFDHPVSHGFENSTHLSVADGIVLVAGSRNEANHAWYNLIGHSAATGEEIWRATYDSGLAVGGSHGEQDQHPVIVGGTIYTRPFAFDLQTGEQEEFRFDRGAHGCGGISGSARYLYGRGGNPRRYDLGADSTSGEPLTHTTRPGCWLNVLAAGGMVLIPESSSGCTCGFAVQTSLALAPTDSAGSAD